MVASGTKLAIFDRLKSGDLTTEAKRQRSILMAIASGNNPTDLTRTGISQAIAKRQKMVSKNIYSAIFKSIENELVPSGLVEESGRLPTKRGPKFMQERGIPFYDLTKKGLVVVLAIDNDMMVFDQFIAMLDPDEREFESTLRALNRISPEFICSIFTEYVKSYCDEGIEELLPFDLTKLKGIRNETLETQRETLETFVKLNSKDKQGMLKLLNVTSG